MKPLFSKNIQVRHRFLTVGICLLAFPAARSVVAQMDKVSATIIATRHDGDLHDDVDTRDRQGHTALMNTVAWTQYDFVRPEEPSVKEAERLLTQGANVNAQDNTGMTALMYAAGWHHLQVLQVLLEHGADVHLRDRMGRTALTWAARDGAGSEIVQALRQHGATVGLLAAVLLADHAAVQTLLAGKVDLTERDGYGETALMVAAEQGNLPLVQTLLAKGANPNAREQEGLTALMLAFAGREQHSIPSGGVSMTGDAEEPVRLPIISALLNAGAHVNARDKTGRTPLLWALRVSTPEAANRLFTAGADVNRAAGGETPLMAALQKRPELVAALLAHGANVNAQDRHGDTVLHKIVQMHDQDGTLLNLLLTHGADVNRPNQEGRTPLMALAENDGPDEEKVQIAQRLLNRGADAFAQDRYGNTALTYAALRECRPLVHMWQAQGLIVRVTDAVLLRDVSLVRSRLAARDDPNAKTPYGDTVLMIAARNSDVDIVRALLAKGADANARNYFGLPILIMAIRGDAWDDLSYSEVTTVQEKPFRVEVVKALLERGAKANAARPLTRATALITAAALGKTNTVRLLLTHGADITCRDRVGNTALALAGKYGHHDIEALLKQAGAKK